MNQDFELLIGKTRGGPVPVVRRRRAHGTARAQRFRKERRLRHPELLSLAGIAGLPRHQAGAVPASRPVGAHRKTKRCSCSIRQPRTAVRIDGTPSGRCGGIIPSGSIRSHAWPSSCSPRWRTRQRQHRLLECRRPRSVLRGREPARRDALRAADHGQRIACLPAR